MFVTAILLQYHINMLSLSNVQRDLPHIMQYLSSVTKLMMFLFELLQITEEKVILRNDEQNMKEKADVTKKLKMILNK